MMVDQDTRGKYVADAEPNPPPQSYLHKGAGSCLSSSMDGKVEDSVVKGLNHRIPGGKKVRFISLING